MALLMQFYVLNPLCYALNTTLRQDTLPGRWLFSPPFSGPVLSIYPSLAEARLEKMIKYLHYFDLLWRKKEF